MTGTAMLLASLYFLVPFQTTTPQTEGEEMEEEETESKRDRFLQEFEQLRDPATGTIPNDRLLIANEYTQNLKKKAAASRTQALNWQERGPVYDFVGPSNGNTRGGAGGYTAGIVQTALVDLGNDPTGNTVFAGSPTGGLWRCTNFLSNAAPNWQPINDFMSNLAVASICQSPANPNIMYMATGDAGTVTLSSGVRGNGVWKSTNGGLNWSLLPNTTGFTVAFKILCDNAGNVYLATGGSGLRRSTDGGTTWTTISPTGLTASNPGYVSDIELSSTGRLHASFGYFGSRVQHAYTDNPATVTTGGWNFSTGIRKSTVTCTRMEMAVQGNTLYAITANSSFNIDSCYKSTDGGQNWTLQNTTAYPTGLGTGQTWYAVTLAINPDNPSEFIAGGLDAYRSTNDGNSVQRITYWVTSAPYVHADHHFMTWYKVSNESRLLIGHDGGISQSVDGGFAWYDRNQNLGIKQFYSCAISPTAGENFIFAGSQDNGCHQLTNPGLSFSTETTGGDGAYVHINQQNSQVQFGSYVYNNYRRSTNGGTSWAPVNFGNTGYFINPFDYDDAKNILYASNGNSNGNNQIRRWNDANTTGNTGSNVLTIDELTRNATSSNATAFKVSSFTSDRLFIGGSSGRVLRLENASTVTSTADITANITDITGTAFPTGYVNCINTGTSDNTLVAVFTNYGINNVWYSNNGGTSWTAIDGNLPDMPVWWAVFVPGSNTKMVIATEAGVYTTDAVNGTSTAWAADPAFPIVRTRMLKVRASDNTIVAATYGRGVWTGSFNSCVLATISSQPASQSACAGSNVVFNVTASGTGNTFQWRKNNAVIPNATGSSYTINSVSAADAASYDVVVTNSCGNTNSVQASLTVRASTTITTQPAPQSVCAGSAASFSVSGTGAGTLSYQWRKGGVNISGATSATYSIPSTVVGDAGNYDVIVTGTCGPVTSIPVALTVNTGGGCVTAVPNIDPDVTTFVLMPNAVRQNTVLRMKVQRAMKIDWKVVDGQGRTVMTFGQKLTAGQTDLPLQFGKLAAGVYYLHGTTEKGRLGTLRFQKL